MPTRTTVGIVIACLMVGAALWWSSPGAAAGALTADDHIKIQQLYSRYYQTIDAGASEAWADTFTPDGSFNTVSVIAWSSSAPLRSTSPRPCRSGAGRLA